ncbi:type II toxin-antitoxin system VapC family toxin [Phenylobacterium sp.]|jgi:PIN domain nuclease of toxin-antitoxin system|uniref:type II toxin-antitoxin system VapC family toxin n=1 Tax=Phenylobacterium sp. TaxID=1871053 RepID=UPI002F92203E
MADVVLDASAVLARLLSEPGEEVVSSAVEGARVSAVNLAEVIARLIDRGVPVEAAVATTAELGIDVIPFDETAALRAGTLRASTRSLGLSLGDRACLALAEMVGLPVLTADRAWAELDLDVEVVLIR